jgi:hypothetical protein
MARPRRTASVGRVLVTAAATSYAANCALGTSVAVGLLDTRGYRWLHHALYLATATLTSAAMVTLVAGRDRAGWTLLPALLPLAALPRASTRTPRHARLGLSAAPFYLATLRRAWR